MSLVCTEGHVPEDDEELIIELINRLTENNV
jgi:hypothetical protein